MINLIHNLVALLTGVLLGGFFFTGLWWTVNRVRQTQRPVMLFLVSSLVRTAIVLSGFWLVGGDEPIALVCCLVGFVAARLLLIHRMPIFGSLKNGSAQ